MYKLNSSHMQKHIYDSDEAYISNNEYYKFQEILKNSLNCSKPLSIVVYGQRHSGRHAFISNVFKSETRPIFSLNSAEIFNENILDRQKLLKTLRICSSIVFRENLKIVVGEVIQLTEDKIHLKTKDMESAFEIGARIKNELIKERVSVGDIIEIYKENGFIIRIGRVSNTYDNSKIMDIKQDQILEGECIRTETMTSILNLDEIDVVNYKEDGVNFLYKNAIVPEKIQNEVDFKINKWIKEDKASFERGVLVIEDAQLINEEDFIRILDHMKLPFCPFLLFISDGCPKFSNQGELRLQISLSDPKKIIQSVANNINVDLDGESLQKLVDLAIERNVSLAIRIMKSSIANKKFSASTMSKLIEIML